MHTNRFCDWRCGDCESGIQKEPQVLFYTKRPLWFSVLLSFTVFCIFFWRLHLQLQPQVQLPSYTDTSLHSMYPLYSHLCSPLCFQLYLWYCLPCWSYCLLYCQLSDFPERYLFLHHYSLCFRMCRFHHYCLYFPMYWFHRYYPYLPACWFRHFHHPCYPVFCPVFRSDWFVIIRIGSFLDDLKLVCSIRLLY